MKYSTLNEAIQNEIVNSIEANGTTKASEYDIDAIADQTIEQFSDNGNVWYESTVEPDEFWTIVENNAN